MYDGNGHAFRVNEHGLLEEIKLSRVISPEKRAEVASRLAVRQLARFAGEIPTRGELKELTEWGEALLSAGIVPSEEALMAMGLTESQARARIAEGKEKIGYIVSAYPLSKDEAEKLIRRYK